MMMRAMRAAAKWIMVIVALSFVGWLVFDVGMDVTGQTTSGVAAEVLRVDGQAVDLQTYYQAVRDAQEQQRQAGVPVPTTLEEQRALEDAVFEQLVQRLILQKEYRRRGITVTDEEVRQALLNFPPQEIRQVEAFQTDGEFDVAKYQRYLRSGADPQFVLALETRYREEIPRLKLFERLTEDVYLSDAKLWQRYRDEHETVTARVLVLIPQVVIADAEALATDEEVTQYYRSHRNEFERPAQAFLSYVASSRLPNAADSAAALARVQRLREEIVAGGDFAAVAQRESADSASRTEGGDLGEVRRGSFVEAFERAALALRPGQLSQPVLTQFGYHLIKLEAKRDDRYHARHILVPVEPVGAHLAAIDARADTLDLLAADRDDPTVLDTVAALLRRPVQTAPPVFQGDRLLLDGAAIPDAGTWAFEAAPGQTSPVIEADHAYYVFRLDSLKPKRVPPVAEIRTEVVEAVRQSKRWEAARALAGKIADAVHTGASLDDVAAAHGLRVRTLDPVSRGNPSPALQGSPEAVGLAFGLPRGRVGGPVETNLAIMFIQPVARQPADSAAFEKEKEELRARAVQEARQAQLQLIFLSLRENANVLDRRRELDRAQQRLAQQ